MPSRAAGWSGFSAVLLLVLPVLAVTTPSTRNPATTPEVASTGVAVALEATAEPLAFVMDINPLLDLEAERPYVEPAPVEPAVRIEALTVTPVATTAAPVSLAVTRKVVPPSEIPVQPVASTRLTRDEVYALTHEMSGDADWAVWATRVIMCESGGQVNAVSPDGHYGLAQVSPIHPYDFSRMLSEPRYAVQAMINIYQSSGPRAWSCK